MKREWVKVDSSIFQIRSSCYFFSPQVGVPPKSIHSIRLHSSLFHATSISPVVLNYALSKKARCFKHCNPPRSTYVQGPRSATHLRSSFGLCFGLPLFRFSWSGSLQDTRSRCLRDHPMSMEGEGNVYSNTLWITWLTLKTNQMNIRISIKWWLHRTWYNFFFWDCIFCQHPASAFLYHSWAFPTCFKIPTIWDSSGEVEWTSELNREYMSSIDFPCLASSPESWSANSTPLSWMLFDLAFVASSRIAASCSLASLGAVDNLVA